MAALNGDNVLGNGARPSDRPGAAVASVLHGERSDDSGSDEVVVHNNSRDVFKRPVASGSTQTDLPHEILPALICRQSSLSQAETKQPIIDSNAAVIAELRRELAALRQGTAAQASSQLSVQAVSLECALCSQLKQLSLDEEKARCDIDFEIDNERAALMLAFHAASASHRTTPDEPCGAQSPHASTSHSGVRAYTATEPASARNPTCARECLFIDHICHRVGTFVRRDWARVCSTSARAVFEAVFEVRSVWLSVAKPLGWFQSEGSHNLTDNCDFGPEPGLLYQSRQAVLDLRNEVLGTNTTDQRWSNRFAVHMELTAILYQELRLRHRQVFAQARDIVVDLGHVLRILDGTLKMRAARTAAAAD